MESGLIELEKVRRALISSSELLLQNDQTSQQGIDNLKEAEHSLDRALNHILLHDRNNRYS
ncbi:hypothetical protein [Bacillus sp. FSL K6-3431]|uniref:hypothetical protein n=1 Tax=Bacillus sp. FSL K6-3431 TaxID=2921500 RepID=UPI0030FA4294